jgi:predicted amidohydrolase
MDVWQEDGAVGKKCTVAVVQAEVAPDVASALERTAALVGEATRAGAELIVFPETWIPGYPAWLDVCRDAALWDHPPVKAVYGRMAENSVAVVNNEIGWVHPHFRCNYQCSIMVD